MNKPNNQELRFFVFFYNIGSPRGTFAGNVSFHNLSYLPSNAQIGKAVSEAGQHEQKHVMVTGWKEMNKADFESFTVIDTEALLEGE